MRGVNRLNVFFASLPFVLHIASSRVFPDIPSNIPIQLAATAHIEPTSGLWISKKHTFNGPSTVLAEKERCIFRRKHAATTGCWCWSEHSSSSRANVDTPHTHTRTHSIRMLSTWWHGAVRRRLLTFSSYALSGRPSDWQNNSIKMKRADRYKYMRDVTWWCGMRSGIPSYVRVNDRRIIPGLYKEA